MPRRLNPLWRRAHVLVCVAVLATVAVAKAQPRDTDADLRAAVNEFVDIWNRHDMTQFGDAFTPDAHFVNVIAIYLDGRAAILDQHAPSHQSGWMRHSTMSGEIRRVQVLSPTLGVVHLHWTSHMDGWLGRLRPRSGEMTFVLRRDSDRWRTVSAQNTDAGLPVGAPGDWLMLALIGGGLGACVAAVRRVRPRGIIIGSVCGMFVVAPLVALLTWNAPMAGGFVGFGVLGTAVGLVVALISRVLIRPGRSSKQTSPR
jgi:uncharacterized protein (TIGR02246 family)